MFEKAIIPANHGDFITKFESKGLKRGLPKLVREQVDQKLFDLYYIYQLFSGYIKNKDIQPIEKIRFGKIKVSKKHRSNAKMDDRIESGKSYYGWKVECRKGNSYSNGLNVLIILGTLSEAMEEFETSPLCKK